MFHKLLKGYLTPHPYYGPYITKEAFDFLCKFYPVKVNGLGGHRVDPRVDYFGNQFLFSMIRDPLDRFISHYNWQVNIMNKERTIEEFLEVEYFLNFQTFRLTGYRDIERAREIIETRYDFIGLLEDFSYSMSILSEELLGSKDKLIYEHSNTSKYKTALKKADLSQKTIAKIKECNQVDFEVYELVKEGFYKNHGVQKQKIINNSLKLSQVDHIKRKLANRYLGNILQPLVQTKVEYGY